jgi:hypothetical protein
MLKKLECSKEKVLAQTDVLLSHRDFALLVDHGKMSDLGPFSGRRRLGHWLVLTNCQISGGPRTPHILFRMDRYDPNGFDMGLRRLYKKGLSFFEDQHSFECHWAVIEVPKRRLPIRDPKRFIEAEARRIAHTIARVYLE